MERNAVAAFLLMLRNFLQGHTVNQESLVQCQGPAIIGALLCKVGQVGVGQLCLAEGTGLGHQEREPDAISQGEPSGRGGT